MATLAKKIYIKNSAGTQQTALIYSTTGESGTPYIYASDGSTTGYVPLCSTSDARATSGRVIKSGTTYAIANIATPAYGSSLYTSTGTFTVPAGVYKVRVTLVGGGAGGADCLVPNDAPAHTNYANGATYNYYVRTTGGTSSFGSYASAAGGQGPTIQLTKQSCTKTISSGRDNSSTVTYSGWNVFECMSGSGSSALAAWCPQVVSNGGGYNVSSPIWDTTSVGGEAVPLTTYDGTVVGYAGAGGNANPEDDNTYAKGGNSGYRTETYVDVTPGQSITCTIGAGGSIYYYGNYYSYDINTGGSPSGAAYVGSAGAILVEWGQGIVT